MIGRNLKLNFIGVNTFENYQKKKGSAKKEKGIKDKSFLTR
jgi:hypothetical protein